jgi:hypothetical protein
MIKGTVKRNALARAIRLDRALSGRGQKARRYRSTGRPTLTRAEAHALWELNRRWTAASLRADRRSSK